MTDLAFPKTIVSVIVYNRFHHLKHWLECWDKCEHYGAQLVVIHNVDEVDPMYQKACSDHGAIYISRHNIGFDIGAFQDVCRERLAGFPSWDRLLWMTDDTFPMSTDFLKVFHRAMEPGVGVACMELSPYVTMHVRTTGFMIDKSTAVRLKFPVETVRTKQHCYIFEHRGASQILFQQVKAMGLKSVMAAPRDKSPMWDIGYHRRLDRLAEHEKLFGRIAPNDKILVVCPVYKNYPQIISSMITQTHQNWELLLIHDGPDTENIKALVPKDERIKWMETAKRGGCWGHYIRQVCVEHYTEGMGYDFLVITNADNYHTPVFLEYMHAGFQERPSAVATYCSQMVHSYKAWQVLDCRLEQGFIDCAGVMVRCWAAKEAGWNDITTHSADWVYFQDLISKFGAHRFHRVVGCLLTHN
jgi:hypothetical protein